jgi:hypothetical protein
MSQEQIHAAVDDAHSAGFQVGIHANGDVTIGLAGVLSQNGQKVEFGPGEGYRIAIAADPVTL